MVQAKYILINQVLIITGSAFCFNSQVHANTCEFFESFSTLREVSEECQSVFKQETRLYSVGSMDAANDARKQRAIEEKRVRDNLTFLDRLDGHRAYFANQFQDVANALDRYMAQTHYDGEKENESYFILKSEVLLNEVGENEYKVRGNAKVDLSNTKKRLKLIFESRPDEDVSLDDRERPNRPGDERLASDDAIAGLQYTKEKGAYEWQPSIDVGSRLNFPLDAFTRVKLSKRTKLNERCELLARVELPYFAREGAKPSMHVRLGVNLTPNIQVSSISRYKYTRVDRFDEWSQSFQLNHFATEDVGLEYKIGAVGNDLYDSDFSTYYFQTAIKFNLYENWIYWTLVPAIEFSEELDWEADTSLSMQFQMIYAD